MTASERVNLKKTIDNLPDDMSLDEVAYELPMLVKAMQGFSEINSPDCITNDEMFERIEEWSR